MRWHKAFSAAAAVLAALLCPAAPGLAHQMRLPVIVDTDLGLDDQRALALVAAAPHLELAAVLTSDGVCPPGEAAAKARRLLAWLGREGVPVGAGPALAAPPPAARSMCGAAYWRALPQAPGRAPDAQEVLAQTLSRLRAKPVYLCLGPAGNLARALAADPGLAGRLAGAVCYASPPGAARPEMNTRRDPAALAAVLGSGLEVTLVQAPAGLALGPRELAAVRALAGPAARLVALQAADPAVRAHAGGGLPVWDELAVLWLHDPSLAGSRPLPGREGVRVLAGAAPEAVRAAYLELLAARGEGPPPRAAVLFTRYPTDPGLYRRDVAPLVPRLIARHGYEEFKAALLTNELHRHLGIISILGAKMGIRARELLGADLDALEVASLAGLEPPMSCLNDGLQTSTGASLGRGTIRVEQGEPRAAAEFRDRAGRRLRLAVRPEVLARLQKDIGRTARAHPGLTPRYFREVRRLALQAWLELDRREVFREEWLAGGPGAPGGR